MHWQGFFAPLLMQPRHWFTMICNVALEKKGTATFANLQLLDNKTDYYQIDSNNLTGIDGHISTFVGFLSYFKMQCIYLRSKFIPRYYLCPIRNHSKA